MTNSIFVKVSGPFNTAAHARGSFPPGPNQIIRGAFLPDFMNAEKGATYIVHPVNKMEDANARLTYNGALMVSELNHQVGEFQERYLEQQYTYKEYQAREHALNKEIQALREQLKQATSVDKSYRDLYARANAQAKKNHERAEAYKAVVKGIKASIKLTEHCN